MGRKGGKYKKKETNIPSKKKSIQFNSDDHDMMNDDIDGFHKQRDVVPLDINDDMGESDEDTEHPVFELEDDKDEDEDDSSEDYDTHDTGLAAKIARTQKYLRAKFGGVDDDMIDNEEDEEEKRAIWGRKKDMYGADVDEPQSSDDEDAAEEEAAVLKLQSERAKALSMADFGLEDSSQDESDKQPTFEEISDQQKPTSKASLAREFNNQAEADYEVVKKDLNALTKEEQMDIVYSSAPELVGLLSELNDALEQLETKINPLASKIRERENEKKGGMHYVEVKQLLLQCYCQAITFYLLLKAEGQPVRDHPVVSRLVEIKHLLDKMKELDENLPFNLEAAVNEILSAETVTRVVGETASLESNLSTKNQNVSLVTSETHVTDDLKVVPELVEVKMSKSSKKSESQHKPQDNQVGAQSIEMLKVRAALEEKLKQKGVFSSIAPKDDRVRKHRSPMNRQLETLDDFDDEAMEIDGAARGKSNGEASLSRPSKLSQLLTRHNKPKVISGDDDIPKRDDIGERRRKHELRVLAGAGIKSAGDVEDEPGTLSSDEDADVGVENDMDSDLEPHKQVEPQHAAKVDKDSRIPELSALPEATVDGKRQITYLMEKNRGLTRARKKLTKNPRKKYKLKHQKAVVRRKGQVRDIRKPTGPYGGEASGINIGISRSIRFKN